MIVYNEATLNSAMQKHLISNRILVPNFAHGPVSMKQRGILIDLNKRRRTGLYNYLTKIAAYHIWLVARKWKIPMIDIPL